MLGPFDGRKKRSRCEACSASHLKCSGQTPCSNCERRGLVCAPIQPQTREIILLERGKQRTLSNWSSSSQLSKEKRRVPAAQVSRPRLILDNDSEMGFLYYFDVFSRANNFGGKERTLGYEVKRYALFRSGEYLRDAMCALGGLQAFKLKAVDLPCSTRQSLTRSLEHYAKAIVGLRKAIDAQFEARGDRGELVSVTILWTTLFLGLFELMNEETGRGWSQHMIHGTAKALEASGPARFRTGPGRGFFTQARVFEVSRTILSNEESFLTQPAWMALSRQMARQAEDGGGDDDDDGDAWRPLDSLLDIMVMCSRLCSVMKARQDEILEPDEDGQPSPSARSVCADGHKLRNALHNWSTSYIQNISNQEDRIPRAHQHETEIEDDELLSRVFFAAISIYLSGIFDYSITHWTRLRLSPSTLDEPALETHLSSILDLTKHALDRTALSPLLFLLPLRIAGARARTRSRRETVAGLVGRIEGIHDGHDGLPIGESTLKGGGFAAAGAVRGDLEEVWARIEIV